MIIDHFEKFLGPIKQGWRDKNIQEGKPSLMIARFSNTPFENTSTYATIGLSDSLLYLPGDRQVKQELLFSAHDTYSAELISSFLLTFCDYVRSREWVLARGDVVGPSAPLIPGVAANAVFACPPVIFPDGIDLYKGESQPTIIVWLVPLVGNESSVVKQKGGSRFEGILEQSNPDLLDLNRLPVASD
ncbi:suppressor of fused domain protein [Burkholderia sp. BE17]|uniref:suppressor of fused domain protein n=1 Tax=Burkholderia sp. BE17 TaxID=2656644 RepID=UPI00128D7E2B|nr:suppressor of fused domain protein [Burkholderia sp. BE17]MPV64456.1 suppressor of fused domain protein [Burkholderia sp. BE17]